jgi:nitroreductase
MEVSEAVASRRSIRQFLPRPVGREVIERVLEKARNAPSGGNVQPWNAIVLTGEPLAQLTEAILAKAASEPMGSGFEYDIYPAGLEGRYEAQRRAVGHAMFEAVGLGRENKAGRMAQMARNWSGFGAPVQLFTYTAKYMGPPQWSDMGMWLQTIMLLLREEGLDSCPQEIWARYGEFMKERLGIDDEHIFFCGMAIGYRDSAAPINTFPVPRVTLAESVAFEGF